MIHDSHLAEIEKLLCAYGMHAALCAYGMHAVEIDAIHTMQQVHKALINIELCRKGYPDGIAKEPEDDSNSKIHPAP